MQIVVLIYSFRKYLVFSVFYKKLICNIDIKQCKCELISYVLYFYINDPNQEAKGLLHFLLISNLICLLCFMGNFEEL